MAKINRILIVLVVLISAGYAIHANIKLRDMTSQYETASLETEKKFEEINEARIREREEFARQKAALEEVRITIEASAAQAAKIAKAGEEKSEPVVVKVPPPAIAAKGRPGEDSIRARAEKAKADVEAMLGQVNTASQPWEEREPHL